MHRLFAVATLLIVVPLAAQENQEKLEVPARSPELFGKVMKIEARMAGVVHVVLQLSLPKVGKESENNEWHRKQFGTAWLIVVKGIPVRRRAGGATELRPGQMIAVWSEGTTFTTNPPTWCPEFIVVEEGK
jgi:hypothetical protein